MKSRLYAKCKSCDFKKLFEKKGYAYFEKGNYNMNIIGVRSNQNNKVTNKYDDCLVLIYNTETGWKRQIYSITTEPGLSIMKTPSNAKGTAILAPGQYRGAYMLYGHIHDTQDAKLMEQILEVAKAYRFTDKRTGEQKAIPFNLINCFCMYSNYIPLTLDEWIALQN